MRNMGELNVRDGCQRSWHLLGQICCHTDQLHVRCRAGMTMSHETFEIYYESILDLWWQRTAVLRSDHESTNTHALMAPATWSTARQLQVPAVNNDARFAGCTAGVVDVRIHRGPVSHQINDAGSMLELAGAVRFEICQAV